MQPAIRTDRDGYTVTASAERGGRAATVTLVVTHTPEAWLDPAENAMAWLDGRLVGQHYGTGEVAAAFDPAARTSTFTWTTPLDAARRNVIHLTVWPRSSPTFPAISEVTFPPFPAPILRTAFHAEPGCWGANTTTTLLAAGFNCTTFGCFINPADNSSWNTFTAWRAAWEGYIFDRQVRTARDAGLLCLVTGDDFYRSPAERDWLLTSPWAGDAVRHAARRLGEAGNVAGLEVQDEFHAPLTDEATNTFLGWWREACDIPVSFPYHSLVGERPWEAEADYLSRYGTILEWRDYSIDGQSVWQWWNAVKRMGADTLGKRWVGLASCCGDFYRHGTDEVHRPGTPPAAVTAQPWLLLAAGASGVRFYALDTFWVSERAAAGAGQLLQTGTAPGDGRWPAVAAAFRAMASREALLAQPAIPAVDSFPWVYGGRPGLRWAVNVSDGDEAAPLAGVLLTPAGEVPVAADAPVPAGGVVLSV